MSLTGANLIMREPEGRYDGHAHVFRSNRLMSEGRRYTPNYDATLEHYANHLRSSRLDGSLLVQPSFLGTDNSQLIEVLEKAKGFDDLTFRGVAMVDPGASVAELARLDEAGIVGIRLNLFGRPQSFDIDDWKGLFKKADNFGWHVEVHCEGSRLPEILTGILNHCQTVVIDHFGLPEQASPLKCRGTFAIFDAPTDQIVVKASAPYRVFPDVSSSQAAARCAPVFQVLYDHLGPHGMLWGSDWPWTRFETGHSFKETLEWQDCWLSALQG